MSQIKFAGAHRPPILGTQGAVASAHPLASFAGIDILKQGGNAFDAAVSVATTLNVVEPYMSGIGGIGILLAFDAKQNELKVLNYSGCTPMAATPEKFPIDNVEIGVLSNLVPGSVSGWLQLHEKFGSMERKDLFSQAIRYARNGYPVTYFNHNMFKNFIDKLQENSAASKVFLPNNNKPPYPGELFFQKDLGDSLELIASKGISAVYKGDIASAIVSEHKKRNGLITTEDLSNYQATFENPISISYKGNEIFVPPPNCSAFQTLQTLKMVERYNFKESQLQNPQTFHIIIEAIKLAIRNRIQYAGDPLFSDIPIDALLSDAYIDSLISHIDKNKAQNSPGDRWSPDFDEEQQIFLNLPKSNGSTTHFSITDRFGNVVTLTQTIGSAFGSGIVVPDTGIMLNNMSSYFITNPTCSTSNLIAPKKRVEFCIAPTQVFRNGEFMLSIGTPGGHGILQTTLQMLMNVLDFNMNMQQAIEAPRFKSTEKKIIELENRFNSDVINSLKKLGHEPTILGDWDLGVGGAQGIRKLNNNVFEAGADPRRDGYAYAW